jgi:uncharacterized protein YjbI with pentapeptide repeats
LRESPTGRLATTLFHGTRVKHLTLHACELEDVLVTGGDDWKKNGFDEVTFEGCKLHKALFAQCRLRKVTIRNVTLDEIKATHVRLEDQVIDGNEAFLRAFGVEQPRASA